MLTLIYTDAHGNDFLLVDESAVAPDTDRSHLARSVCDRASGAGADGLIFFSETARGARMQLRNADGSYSEVSGNGVRCLAAYLASRRTTPVGGAITIETDAGPKLLTLVAVDDERRQFRAAMGAPSTIRRFVLDVGGEAVDVATLSMGNPQCVVLDQEMCTIDDLHRLGGRIAVHPHFPEGTNVEFVRVTTAGEFEILIWERGVGPTASSGTGTSAAAVAAAAFLGAPRDVIVRAPGGAQRVEWLDDSLYLTGWASVVKEISI